MTKEEIKILAESLKEAATLGTIGALDFLKAGLERLKNAKIPVITYDSSGVPGMEMCRKPNLEESIDFLVGYLQTAADKLDNEIQLFSNKDKEAPKENHD